MRAAVSPHLSDDRLTDLVLKLLPDREASDALSHLRRCPSCESRFRESSRDREQLRLQRVAGTDAAESRDHAISEERSAAGESTRLLRAAPWSAAAALIVLGLLSIFLLKAGQPGDPLDYWLPIQAERVAFRSGTPLAERFSEALDAYNRRDTRRTIELLDGPSTPEPLKLVLASALVWEHREAEARTVLDQLHIETLPPPARDRAWWILVAAHWRSEDLGAAEVILNDLARRDGEFAERARQQLETLRQRSGAASP